MFKIAFVFLFLSSLLFANGKPTNTDKEIIELSLDYKFDEADRLMKELFSKSDELKNHYLFLNIELIRAIHSAEIVPFKYKRSVKDSVNKILINYSEKVIEEYEDKDLSIYEQFYLGSIYGMLGRFYGVNRSWFSAFSNGKEGRNILEDVIEADPNFVDAYLLLGMMNYYADRLGGVTEFVASILGLSGDRIVGLKYLKDVEKDGNLTNWQATMILSELYARMENNKFDALPLLKKFNSSFPNNTHFANWYCYELVDLKLVKDAGKIITSSDGDKVTDMVKGKYYHLIGEYEKSKEIYDTLLAEKGMIYPWVYRDGQLNQVVNYIMLNDITKAEKLSQELNERNLDNVKQMIKNPKLTKEIINFRKNLLLDNNEAIVLTNNPPNFNRIKLFESMYNYFLGIDYFKKNKLHAAEKYFIKTKELDYDNYGYDSIKYLIQIYKTTNANRDSVIKLLDEIDDLDNDGFEFSGQDLEIKYNL